jgi:adenylate kinase
MRASRLARVGFVAGAAVFDGGRLPVRMNRPCLILFGPPGSGKGTQAKLLRAARNMEHISTGDMLRERVASSDGLGRELAAIMQSGSLVPDETVNRMVEERLDRSDSPNGYILDGYPRTVPQAMLLDRVFKAKHTPVLVVHLRVEYNVIIGRLSGRRQCPNCGALYNLPFDTTNGSEVCNQDGSRLIVREDDRPEVVLERLKAYDLQTAPVLKVLRDAGYPCCEVSGASRAPRVIAEEILKLMDRELTAANVGESGAA